MLKAIVHGDVQGVGFRMTAKMIADRKGYTGSVRNLGTGSVEIIFQGERDQLEDFLQEITLRLPTGSINDIQIEPCSSEPLTGFSILR